MPQSRDSKNGIALTIQDCGRDAPCLIWIPATYPLSEPVPGSNMAAEQNGAETGGNIAVRDFRYGEYDTAVDPPGRHPQYNYRAWKDWSVNYHLKPIARGTNEVLLNSVYNAFEGGANWLQNGYLDKTNWLAFDHRLNSFTPGQHIGVSYTNRSYSLGDSLLFQGTNYCWGGYVAGGDEGCEVADWEVFQGGVEYSGSITSDGAAGASSLTIKPVQGSGTQGAGRFLIDLASAKTISGGRIAEVTSPGDALTTVMGAGTAWPVSTILARLGRAVPAPETTVTVKPDSFKLGSIASITPATLLCVADGGAFEMLYPSAVDTAAGAFTALFLKPHTADAVIAAGGLCGYLIDFDADDVTDSTFPSKIQAITGTLHFGWPAVASPGASSALIWVAGLDGYKRYPGNWTPTHSGYRMFPSAEVRSVQQKGVLSNSLTLSPNNAPWANGDPVAETLYPATHVTMGNFVLEKYYPHFSNAAGFGYALTLNGVWSGGDSGFLLSNNTPDAFYRDYGGALAPPLAVTLLGRYSYGMKLYQPPSQAAVGILCRTSGCNSSATALQVFNASGFDLLSYDQVRQRFRFTGGNRAAEFFLDPKNGLIAPAIQVGNETFTSAPRGTYSTFLPGPLNTTWVGSTFTPDHDLVVTRVQVQAKTSPAGCATNAVITAGDASNHRVSLTVTRAANDSGAVQQPFAQGKPITVSVSVAAAGCAISPSDANVVVQYRLE